MKDELISQTVEQKDPYRVKGSDFPVKSVKAGHGQSGAAGEASGTNELVRPSPNQDAPRHAEDGGRLTPSEWGKGGAEFSVGRATGEAGTSVSIPESVNLASGAVEVKGYKATRADETPDKGVSIG